MAARTKHANSCCGEFCKFLTVLNLFICLANSHPQCMDSKPPFKSEVPLQLCPQYSEFGCCTSRLDTELKNYYESVLPKLEAEGLKTVCEPFFKELLCQKCSPYAAHIYAAEEADKPEDIRIVPGLCNSYCQKFYLKCKNIVKYLAPNDTRTLSSLHSAADFCRGVILPDTDYCYPDLLANMALNDNLQNQMKNEEGCLCLKEIVTGLRNPVFARSPMDNTSRLFIGEQIGLVHIYEKGRLLETPFLDIKDKILTSSRRGDERGFLGMTFHPKFKMNGKFYIYYSATIDGSQHVRISEMKANGNRYTANRNTERTILEVKEPFWNHNGGELLFGDDGYLYVFLGDGGSQGDPNNNAQRLNVLLGKVLRLDVDTGDPNIPYKIPTDNPFVSVPGARGEIYAYGIRNIWRCSVDPGERETGAHKGRIICGDVGQNKYEEIDIIEKGGNYGWRTREGFGCYKSNECGSIGPEVLPIFAYNHTVGKSVTGGYVYRGCHAPSLQGSYIYGDFMNGRMFRLREDRITGEWHNRELFMCGEEYCKNGLTSKYPQYIISFGEDEERELYMMSTQNPAAESPQGSVYKIVDPRSRANPDFCDDSEYYKEFGNLSPSNEKEKLDNGDTDKDVSGADGVMWVKSCVLVPTVMCVYYAL